MAAILGGGTLGKGADRHLELALFVVARGVVRGAFVIPSWAGGKEQNNKRETLPVGG